VYAKPEEWGALGLRRWTYGLVERKPYGPGAGIHVALDNGPL
jgi:hypothetical protein